MHEGPLYDRFVRVRRHLFILLWLFLAAAATQRAFEQAGPSPAAPTQPALRQQLLDMQSRDQAARFALLDWMKNHRPPFSRVDRAQQEKLQSAVQRVDAADLAELKRIISLHGWPGYRLVGRQGADAAWLLVQHADRDHAFQRGCLEILKRAVTQGDAGGPDLAYLEDRVLVAERRPQVFGTQLKLTGGKMVLYPTVDPQGLDARRASMGLPPMAEYMKLVKQMYGGK